MLIKSVHFHILRVGFLQLIDARVRFPICLPTWTLLKVQQAPKGMSCSFCLQAAGKKGKAEEASESEEEEEEEEEEKPAKKAKKV